MTAALMLSSERARRAASHSSAAASPTWGKVKAGEAWVRPARQNTHLPIDRGWPKLKVVLSLLWRWRGVLEGESAEASGRPCVSLSVCRWLLFHKEPRLASRRLATHLRRSRTPSGSW